MNQHTFLATVWTVVLRPDGHVSHVEGAPNEWIGRDLADAPAAPRALQQAARLLLERPSANAGFRHLPVQFQYAEQRVTCELVLLEALPLRRAFVPLDELLLRTLDTFLVQARSNAVDIQLERASTLPLALNVDREKIAWALATLVGNALRSFDDEAARAEPAHIVLQASCDPHSVQLAVRDNGRGMPASHVRWLFEQDPNTGRSAGLALAMVHDVMVAHRGKVTACSALGRGTTITLHLPRAPHA